jgi:hypothetical protein
MASESVEPIERWTLRNCESSLTTSGSAYKIKSRNGSGSTFVIPTVDCMGTPRGPTSNRSISSSASRSVVSVEHH